MLEDFSARHDLPKFRISQFRHGFYRELIGSFSHLSTWPKDLRDELVRSEPVSRLTPITSTTSRRGDTVKVLFGRRDGGRIETVLMRHRDGRNTVCVSCMVGCPVNCSFCATGKLGFRSNLTADEIVDQVLHFARLLKSEGQTVTNVVFMGMGEPMLNLSAVVGAVGIMTGTDMMGMSQRRLTVSTSGCVPQLREFVAGGFEGRLAISLHAPNQKLRETIMPIAKAHAVSDVLAVADEFAAKTRRRVSYEYVLLAGVNDGVTQARELAALLTGRLAHVNLIPYNPTPGVSFRRPDRRAMEAFAEVLAEAGIPHTLRVTMGDDIKAACGQLDASEAYESMAVME